LSARRVIAHRRMLKSVTIRPMSGWTSGGSHPTAPYTTAEFRMEDAARVAGNAYVRYRDDKTFHAVALDPGSSVVYIGRDRDCAIRIENDTRVSRRHARLIFGAGRWSIQDGPSRNGTFLADERTVGEQLLADGALITVGRTLLSFHMPLPTVATTIAEMPSMRRLHPTATQRKVLVELARPAYERPGEIPVVPTNAAIAKRLGYADATIRDAVSDLYRQAGLTRGASDQRSELVRLAIRERAVTAADFA
jgi:pSer/pThr/pTyr-binding forkhead associated (FHA) protein